MLKKIIIILLLPSALFAELQEIGTIVQLSGKVDILPAGCYNEYCRRDDNRIFPGDKIQTMPSSMARILFKDGTGIEITGQSSITIKNIRQKEKDMPSLLRAHYGTLTITQNNRFTDTSLVIETETSVVKSVSASLYIIAAKDETAIMVYSSRAGVASSDPSIRKAYILTEGEQTFVLRNQPPGTPEKTDILLRGSWLTKHHLSKDLSRVILRSRDNSVIDWIFRNRD